jgi:hypothetical protein
LGGPQIPWRQMEGGFLGRSIPCLELDRVTKCTSRQIGQWGNN